VVVLAAGLGGALAAAPARAGARGLSPVAAENLLPGDGTWEQAIAAHVNYVHPPITGYADATSVRPGGTIGFAVSVQRPGRYRVAIVRLGWYQGHGGRRLTCLVGSALDASCTADQPGLQQSAPPPPAPGTGEVDDGWAITDRLNVPTNWVSGYYLAIFELTAGPDAGQTGFTPFVVQAPAGVDSSILVQVPTNTWQAYNTWGGEDLYTTPEAVKVSFDRPYQNRYLFRWEYGLVRFLERHGYDVSYATDDDVDRDPALLLDHRLDIAAGHGEYWTAAERDGWDTARARGVNLAFMGANTGYWQVRYEDGDRTMVSYKSDSDPEPDPARKTIRFRFLRPPRPECELMGEQYAENEHSSAVDAYYDYKVSAAGARDPWLAGTGLRAGTRLRGLVGYEFDSPRPGCHVPPLTVLLRFHGNAIGSRRRLEADAVRYRACSGSEVFDAGSLQFSWGLDDWRDPEFSPPAWPPPPPPTSAVQRMVTNMIADMLIAHPRLRMRGVVQVRERGRQLAIDPGVRRAAVRARIAALGVAPDGRPLSRVIGISHRRRSRWRLRLPAWAAAVRVRLRVRTGTVIDSGQYLLPARGGHVVSSVLPLSAASCYGGSARVLTPVFAAGSRSAELALALDLPGPFSIDVLQHGRRVRHLRARRRHGAAGVLAIAARGLPRGRLEIVISAPHARLRVAALGA
jgi:hypothetical protein